MELHLHLSEDDIPDAVGDAAKLALIANSDRLKRAAQVDDVEQVIGACKDLVECVAKVVLDALGQTYGSNEDLPKLSKAALGALGAHPSAYQGRPPLQRLTSSLSQIPQAVAELRNQDGTGHGRVNISDLRAENAAFTAAASVAWSHWMLAALRISMIAIEGVTKAVNEIEGSVFHRGDMPELLAQLQLEELEKAQQHRLGLAVARRWMDSGTFLARVDVIKPLIDGQASYPPTFARGILEGLLFNERGNLRMTCGSIRDATAVSNGLDDEAIVELTGLVNAIEGATPAYSLMERNEEVLAALSDARRGAMQAVAGELFDSVRNKLEETWGLR